MRTSMPSSCFLLIGIVGAIAVPGICAQTSQELILKEAESRLRAIYERKEFRAKRFRADWLSDSSGYTVLESVPDGNEQVLVRYDVPSGKRTVLDSPQREKSGRMQPTARFRTAGQSGAQMESGLPLCNRIPPK